MLFFSSPPFVKEHTLLIYVNVSMIKGCKHKLALICKQNLNALVFFLQNEVNVRFHLTMGTIVLNRKLLFCYNSTTLLIRKRLGDHPFGGLSRWKELVIYYAKIPKIVLKEGSYKEQNEHFQQL